MDPQAEEGTAVPREQSWPEMQAEREAPGKMRQYAATLLFSALCDAWLLRKRDEIRESSYIKYRAILGGISSRGWAAADWRHLHRVGRCLHAELLETDGLSVKTVHDILSVLHSVLKDTEARR